MNCAEVREKLDLWIDGEAGGADAEQIGRHLETCGDCAGVLANRRELRDRVRKLSRTVARPEGLASRIHSRIAADEAHNHNRWGFLAIAAAVLVSAGTYLSLHRPSAIMEVGLQQHIHCAVLRNYAAGLPEPAALAREIGPAYAGLIPVVQKNVPRDFSVVMAHQCTFEGRNYVHVIARRGTDLISLLLTKRGEGEAFENDLRAVAAEDGTSEYSSSAQHYSIAGFETSHYLVYLVSDLDRQTNLNAIEAMTPQIKATLAYTT